MDELTYTGEGHLLDLSTSSPRNTLSATPRVMFGQNSVQPVVYSSDTEDEASQILVVKGGVHLE